MRESARDVIEENQLLVAQSRFRIERANAEKQLDAELIAGVQRQLTVSRKALAASRWPCGRPP